MSTFFLHNSEIYGYQIDASIMTLNPNNVITFNFSAPSFPKLQLTNLPTSPAGLPPGSVWKQGDFLCIVP